MKKIFLFFFIFLISCNLNGEYISFYPDIPSIQKYVNNLISIINNNDRHIKIFKAENNIFFPNAKSILKSLQLNQINFALIPFYRLSIYDINNNLNRLLLKISNEKVNNSVDVTNLIPLKIELEKYNIFLIDIIPLGSYYIFSNKNVLRENKKDISIALLNPLLMKKIEKVFPNTFIVENLDKLKSYIKSGFFNTAILTISDYYKLNHSFKYIYKTDLPFERLALIANFTYWNQLNLATKSLIWSIIYKNKQLFIINHKKFKDAILNNLTIKYLSIH